MRACLAGGVRYTIGLTRFAPAVFATGLYPVTMRACLAGDVRYTVGLTRFDAAVRMNI